ncbi:tol-Pal system protein TolA-like [Thrips palmi]|uniref:Tol-Pal system protein TolA-like n=1 Tax=Thrips palmi TaxID=161013 RepID=A0A6P8YZX7_THRPL|nr:tol-Pal system protein TolA-like [Thrips palmi]
MTTKAARQVSEAEAARQAARVTTEAARQVSVAEGLRQAAEAAGEAADDETENARMFIEQAKQIVADDIKRAVEEARREERAKHDEMMMLAVQVVTRDVAAKDAAAIKLAVEEAKREEAAKHAEARRDEAASLVHLSMDAAVQADEKSALQCETQVRL